MPGAEQVGPTDIRNATSCQYDPLPESDQHGHRHACLIADWVPLLQVSALRPSGGESKLRGSHLGAARTGEAFPSGVAAPMPGGLLDNLSHHARRQ